MTFLPTRPKSSRESSRGCHEDATRKLLSWNSSLCKLSRWVINEPGLKSSIINSYFQNIIEDKSSKMLDIRVDANVLADRKVKGISTLTTELPLITYKQNTCVMLACIANKILLTKYKTPNKTARSSIVIGPIPWGHSGPICHTLSLSSLWTSHAACAIAIAGVRLATPGD